MRSYPTVKLLRGGRAPAHVVASLEGGGPEWPVKFFETLAKVATPLELDRLHEFFDDLLASAARETAGARSHYAERTAASGGELVARFGSGARGGGGARDRLVAAAADRPTTPTTTTRRGRATTTAARGACGRPTRARRRRRR